MSSHKRMYSSDLSATEFFTFKRGPKAKYTTDEDRKTAYKAQQAAYAKRKRQFIKQKVLNLLIFIKYILIIYFVIRHFL